MIIPITTMDCGTGEWGGHGHTIRSGISVCIIRPIVTGLHIHSTILGIGIPGITAIIRMAGIIRTITMHTTMADGTIITGITDMTAADTMPVTAGEFTKTGCLFSESKAEEVHLPVAEALDLHRGQQSV